MKTITHRIAAATLFLSFFGNLRAQIHVTPLGLRETLTGNVQSEATPVIFTGNTIATIDQSFNVTLFGLGPDPHARFPATFSNDLNVNRTYFGVGVGGLAEFNGSGLRGFVWDNAAMKWSLVSPNPLDSVFNTFDFLLSRADYTGDGTMDLLTVSPIPGGGTHLVEFDRDGTGLFTVDNQAVPVPALDSNEFLRAMAPCDDLIFFAKGFTSGSLAGTFKVQVRLQNGVEGDAPGALGLEQFSGIDILCVYRADGNGRVLVGTLDSTGQELTVRVFDCHTGGEIPSRLVVFDSSGGFGGLRCNERGDVTYTTQSAVPNPTKIFTPVEADGQILWSSATPTTPNAAGFTGNLGEATAEIEGTDQDLLFWNNGDGKVETTASREDFVLRPIDLDVRNFDGSPGRLIGERIAILDTDGDGDDDAVTFPYTRWIQDAGQLQQEPSPPPAGFDPSVFTGMERFDTVRRSTGGGPTSAIIFSAPDVEPVILEFEPGTGNPVIVPNDQVFGGAVPTCEQATGDIDGDGLDDLISIDPTTQEVTVTLSSTGSPTKMGNPFTLSGVNLPAGRTYIADVNSDGLADLVSQRVGDPTRVLLAEKTPGSVQFNEIGGPEPLGPAWGNPIFDGVFAADPLRTGNPLLFRWTATFGIFSSVHHMDSFRLPIPPDTDQDGIPDGVDPNPGIPDPVGKYLDYVLGYPIGTGPGSLPTAETRFDSENDLIVITYPLGPQPVPRLLHPEASFEDKSAGFGGNAPAQELLRDWERAKDLSNIRVFTVADGESENQVEIHIGTPRPPIGIFRLSTPPPPAE